MSGDAGIAVRTVAVRQALEAAKTLTAFDFPRVRIAILEADSSVWAHFTTDRSSLALRLAYTWDVSFITAVSKERDTVLIALKTEVGLFEVRLTQLESDGDLIRCETTFTPGKDFSLPDWPRDLYVFGPDLDPGAARGKVHAAQRGFNSGLLHLSLEGFGSALYFQDYTSLAGYFETIGLGPDSAVGGHWPEMGYSAPVNIDKPLAGGTPMCLLDTYLAFSPESAEKPQRVCDQFLTLLARIYLHLNRPETTPHDWLKRAPQTLRDLARDKRVLRHDYGQLYLRPYVEAEYPDSMVQMSVLTALVGYGKWRGRRVPLTDRLSAGMSRFYDPELRTLRRYLPNVGKDKDADEVDAWYLYHPLKNLGHAAKHGERWAAKLFFDTIGTAVKIARHFNYRWPVTYNVKTLAVTKDCRKPGDPGQSDVGGIYAYVMLQAFELTNDREYLEEAQKAIEALSDYTFDLLYQSNLSAFGAAACAWLYHLTEQGRYIEQCSVFVANLIHNSIMWQSQIGAAKNYQTFLGVTCLHDGPYMAAYECFESCAALREVLFWAQDALPEHVRLFAAESSRYGLDRAKFFFPDQLPQDAVATEFRNGRVDRALSIPMEDLYPDGQPAGSVGQEVYGAGAPFLFCIHGYHRLKKGRGYIFGEYPARDITEDGNTVTMRILGPSSCAARIAYVPCKGAKVAFTCDQGERQADDSYSVLGGSKVTLTLEP
jgi:hypothetical protein